MRADSSEEAYDRALQVGAEHESTYTNPDGNMVTARFRGLRDLYVSYDELEHGAEVLYSEADDVPEEELARQVTPKEKLAVLVPWTPPAD